jgi:hypothetical protein
MRLDSVRQRRLTEMTPFALAKGKFDIVFSPAVPANHILSQLADVLWNIHLFKAGVIAHALEEWHTEAWAISSPRTQHSMDGTRAHTAGQRFKALAYRYHEGAVNWFCVNPFSARVLRCRSFSQL